MPGVESDDDLHEIRSPRLVFAERFAVLYVAAGNPTLRKVAHGAESRMRATKAAGARATVSVQRISDWRAGRNIPARFDSLLPVLLTLIELARATGDSVGAELLDVRGWQRLWATADGWNPDDGDGAVCPYRGLAAYRRDDARLFFGRSRPAAELAELVQDTLASVAGGVMVLPGASGAGKSSLLAAGLLAVVADPPGEWATATMTPTAKPLAALRSAVGTELGDWAVGLRRVLIVDQFEELFTACADEAEREAFIALLDECATADSDRRIAVVLGVRADFYGRCLDHAVLRDALRDRSYPLGPMTVDELASAITAPAEVVGLKLEAGLEELLIAELRGLRGGDSRPSYDPGALPLLAHVMESVWRHREGTRLSVAGYRKAGGVAGSVTETAERLWDELTQAQQSAAKQLLLSLVSFGDDTIGDTRRRATREQLMAQSANVGDAAAALEALVAARLVTLDAESAALTHEIVLDAWPRLRCWIDEDRAGNAVRQRLDADAADWLSTGEERSLLYSGSRLSAALEHHELKRNSSPTERFLEAGRRANRRSKQRLTALRGGLALVAAVLLVLTVIAYAQNRIATRRHDDALFASVVAAADHARATDPTLSAQLDLVANRLRPDDPATRYRLWSSEALPLATTTPAEGGALWALAYRSDGILATGGDDRTVQLWNAKDPRHPFPVGAPLGGFSKLITSLAFSPDGRTLVAASGEHSIRLWNVDNLGSPRLLGAPITAQTARSWSTRFSPDGRLLAVANDDHTLGMWDTTDPAGLTLIGVLVAPNDTFRSIAFSPDGQTLATATIDFSGTQTSVQLWNIADPGSATPEDVPASPAGTIAIAVAFNRDGSTLAVGSENTKLSVLFGEGAGFMQLWDVRDPAHPRAPGPAVMTSAKSGLWSLAFSPDDRMVATGDLRGARLWNVVDPSKPTALGEALTNGRTLCGSSGGARTCIPGGLAPVFAPDGHTLATVGLAGSVQLWSLPSGVLAGPSGWVSGPDFSADGRIMVASSFESYTQLWNVRDPANPHPYSWVGPTVTRAPAISPDGRTVALPVEGGQIALFGISDPDHVRALAEVPGNYAVFAADSHRLATDVDDHSTQLWDLSNPGQPTPVGPPLLVSPLGFTVLKFVPGVPILATFGLEQSTNAHVVTLWDIAGSAPRQLSQIKAGPIIASSAFEVSRDGRTLVTTNDETMLVWDIGDPARPVQLGRPLSTNLMGTGWMSFNSDGHLLAINGGDGGISLWDFADRVHPSMLGESLTPLSDNIWSDRFYPAGDVLAAGGADGGLRLWDLNTEHAARRICDVAGSITPQVWQEYIPQVPYFRLCG